MLGHYANECKNDRESSWDGKNDTFAMKCYQDTEDDKNGNGDDENKQESKNPEVYERNVGPGTARNTEEPQETQQTQLYVGNIFMTQVTNEWELIMIEYNSASPRVTSLFRSLMESSKHGEAVESRNMINIHLDREKSTIEHRSSNVPCPVENVAHAQPSVSHEEDEIQNSNFGYVPRKRPREDREVDDRKPAAKRIKKEPEDEAQSVTRK